MDFPDHPAESLFARYHRPDMIGDDPLLFSKRYPAAADAEVAALLAASFAWGNVAAIRGALERLFARLGPEPSRFLREADAAGLRRAAAGLYYRRIHERDLEYLFRALGGVLRAHGSLEALWSASRAPEDATTLDTAPRFAGALRRLGGDPPRSRGKSLAGEPLAPGAGLAPFGLAEAAAGSPYKRVHLFLRWVVRPADGIDLGLWRAESPARLVVPLDVHMLRVARELGLTARKDASAKTALEVTAALRAIDAADPARFDFALVRYGMANARR
ncbi:MAG: TIGR02757 family protein [Candidatus Sumerlaeia bacterium]|nr:TIGR02757 family protein [Candidatus Sumerlaeia bacterium]